MNADEPKPEVKAAEPKPETTAPVPDPKALELTRDKNADEPKPATPVEIKTAGKPDAKLGTMVGSKPKVELEETKPEAKTVAPKTRLETRSFLPSPSSAFWPDWLPLTFLAWSEKPSRQCLSRSAILLSRPSMPMA